MLLDVHMFIMRTQIIAGLLHVKAGASCGVALIRYKFAENFEFGIHSIWNHKNRNVPNLE
jgi:hypothetical protein